MRKKALPFVCLAAIVTLVAAVGAACSASPTTRGPGTSTGKGGAASTSTGGLGGVGGGLSGSMGVFASTSVGSGPGVDGCACPACKSCQGQCGKVGDGCGNIQDCGNCPSGQACVNSACVACTPTKTCASQNLNCGQTDDGCGNILTCGPACGTGMNCTGLCLQQMPCSGGGTTSVSGTVYSPNGADPLPGVLVYVPNAPVQPFTPGVSCGDCGADVSGAPLVSAITDVKGTFTINNMPIGANIPLVIQKGRWRRQFTIPNVAMCTNTPLPTSGAGQIRMPKTDAVHAGGEGDIPLMGFVTGVVDALECVLRKIGIADSEFSDPSGTGRVRFYVGSGGPGATYSASTPDETTLWGSQSEINKYDMVYFACQGSDYEKTAAQQSIVETYANSGGRVFATHYSYVWLYNQNDATNPADSFSKTAQWAVDPNGNNTFVNDPQTGFINMGFPRGQTLAQWLQVVGASTTLGQIQINTLRDDFKGVLGKSVLWINVNDTGFPPFIPGLGNVPMHYTFDTPVAPPPGPDGGAGIQCGRVLYSDFHVENANTAGQTFPGECDNQPMSPQEKMLEFMIFDLGSCVTGVTCPAKTCQELGVVCGPVGDGCGNIIPSCGSCPSGMSCAAGMCGGTPCVPKNCSDQGFNCGMATDTCGNIIDCGSCSAGQICGGGVTPKANVCGGSPT